MDLLSFLKYKKITAKKFAKLVGVSNVTISRYINGSRIPNKNILKKILFHTEELVTANDFHDLKKKTKSTNELQKADKRFIKQFINKIKSGSRKYLAKSITLIESNKIKDQKLAEELVSQIKKSHKTIRIGISGVPGVGKSTFIESFGLSLINKGYKVAVLAVDPSSVRTGGSILGDKTRMEKLSVEKKAFIRPSANAGHLGGVTKKTRESILCLELAGYEFIFIETMGVGQAETEVYNMVDIFLVLLLPAGGDDLQGIKKGIIELADLLVVNKADESLSKIANITVNDYQNALSIISSSRNGWQPKALKCSSKESTGIEKIFEEIMSFIKIMQNNGDFFETRKKQNINWLWEMTENKINNYVKYNIKNKKYINYIKDELLKENIDVNYASNKILTNYLKNFK